MLYVDRSALVKRYIEEEHRQLVLSAITGASRITTTSIANAEVRAAFARRWRAGDLNDEEISQLVSNLDRDWNTFTHLAATESIARRAGELAQRYALRGFDAVHLTTALQFAERFENLTFLAFDHRLIDAARSASLRIFGDGTA